MKDAKDFLEKMSAARQNALDAHCERVQEAFRQWVEARATAQAHLVVSAEGSSERFWSSVEESDLGSRLRESIWRAFGARVGRERMAGWLRAVFLTIQEPLRDALALPNPDKLASFLWRRYLQEAEGGTIQKAA